MQKKNEAIMDAVALFLKSEYHRTIKDAKPEQIHYALSRTLMAQIADQWQESAEKHQNARHAYYFSAEFLIGRAIQNNMLSMGLTSDINDMLRERGADLSTLEEIEDCALGNGGLGRLAACFLDSAATLDLPLDGYGIRYKYGLFKQTIVGGFQQEEADDWTRLGDPWSLRREDEAVTVSFRNQTIKAVPYDVPVIGYGTKRMSVPCVCGRRSRSRHLILISLTIRPMTRLLRNATAQKIFPACSIRTTPRTKAKPSA